MFRVALNENVTRDDIDDAMFEGGFQLTDIVPAGDSHPYQMIYASADRSGLLYLIEDARLGLRYVQAVGGSQAQTLSFICDHLAVCTRESIALQLASPDDLGAHARALYGLALTTLPQTEDEDAKTIESALSHASPLIRRAALIAVSYAPLPALRAPLARVAMSDPDVAIRAAAAEIASSVLR